VIERTERALLSSKPGGTITEEPMKRMRFRGCGGVVPRRVDLAFAQSAPSRTRPSKLTVAEGIYLFTTPGYGDVGLDGNSVVIVSNDGVLVFDTNGTPAAAAAVLAEIRTITPQPVRYERVVITGDLLVNPVSFALSCYTRGDKAVAAAFRVQLIEWFLHRVYEEAAGPLTDAMAPIPKKQGG
jgi:hypothetical protein